MVVIRVSGANCSERFDDEQQYKFLKALPEKPNTLRFTSSAEFSDTKVLNVMTQSRGIGQSQLAAHFATGQFTNRSRSG
jgi:hypothetical protein